MEEKGVTFQELLAEGAARLGSAGISEARLDAERLLLAAFGMDEAHFLLERMKPIASFDFAANLGGASESGESPGTRKLEESEKFFGLEKAAEYRRMIAERARRKPLQQILGQQEFMGLSFQVNEYVLIPRQDTETLVELVLAEQKDTRKRILDLCTGSGCIAVSLATLGGYRDVTAADLSAEALKVAKVNADRLLGSGWRIETVDWEMESDGSETGTAQIGSRETESRYFRLVQGDLFSAVPPDIRYDVLVSNPPYIPMGVIANLQPEVRDYEPRMALDGSGDGLIFYRRIAAEAAAHLQRGAAVYLEIGYDQAEAVRALLGTAGFVDIRVLKDLPGMDRVVCAVFAG